jgi:hypothetical protein
LTCWGRRFKRSGKYGGEEWVDIDEFTGALRGIRLPVTRQYLTIYNRLGWAAGTPASAVFLAQPAATNTAVSVGATASLGVHKSIPIGCRRIRLGTTVRPSRLLLIRSLTYIAELKD